jgi:hypothetical protein
VGWRRLLVVPLLALSTVACVQRVEPFYEARITAVVPPAYEGDVGWVHGTVTNLADFPMDFTIYLAGLFPLHQPQHPAGGAQSVPSGQTAVWRAPYVHPDYTPRIGTVEYKQEWPNPTHAQAVITHVGPAHFAGWSEVTGTLTNTGTVGSGFVIDVQTANGEGSSGHVSYVAPGQTATWENVVFHGIPQAPRVVRVSSLPPLLRGVP